MRFSEFTSFIRALGLPEPASRRSPPRDDVRAIQRALAAALTDPEFVLDFLELEHAAMARRDSASSHLAPFAAIAELGVRFALACWPRGFSSNAHEHSDWTVTAVVHGTLEVATYDWEATRAARALVPKNEFTAVAGQVGHIYGPCVHRPFNASARAAVSFHVLGPHDGPVLEPEVGAIAGLVNRAPAAPIDDPLSKLWRARHEQLARRVHVEMLGAIGGERASSLLGAQYESGDRATRRVAVEAIGARDPERAARYRRELERTELALESVLVRTDLALPLGVRERGDGRVELVAGDPASGPVLARVERSAGSALRYLAERPSLAVGDLPGPLGDEDRRLLAGIVVDWGVFETLGGSS